MQYPVIDIVVPLHPRDRDRFRLLERSLAKYWTLPTGKLCIVDQAHKAWLLRWFWRLLPEYFEGRPEASIVSKATLFALLLFASACTYDLNALNGTSDAETSDTLSSPGASEHDAGLLASDAKAAGIDAASSMLVDSLPSPDAPKPAVDLVPEAVVPRRNGVTCTRDDQCGHPTFVHGKMKCIDGRCSACTGFTCGICERGAAAGLACPVRGTTSSACGACAGDNRLWCTSIHPCKDGSVCLLSSCV